MKIKTAVRDLAGLIGIAKKGGAPSGKVEAALVEARAEVAAATAEREAADAAYFNGILDSTPAETDRLDADRAAATRRFDRAVTLVDALTKRLAAARDDEGRAARKAIHDAALAKSEAIKARLPAEYRTHALALRGLLHDLAEAEVARQRANAEAYDFPPILSPEDEMRQGIGEPEEVLSHKEVRLWTIEGRSDPIADEMQSTVRSRGDGTDRGYLTPSPGGTGGSSSDFPCVRRSFTRTEFRERISAVAFDRLFQAISLPSLHPYGDAYCIPEKFREADTAVAHLGCTLRPDPVIGRDVKVRLEMVPQEPAKTEPFEVIPIERTPPRRLRMGDSALDPATPLEGRRA